MEGVEKAVAAKVAICRAPPAIHREAVEETTRLEPSSNNGRDWNFHSLSILVERARTSDAEGVGLRPNAHLDFALPAPVRDASR